MMSKTAFILASGTSLKRKTNANTALPSVELSIYHQPVWHKELNKKTKISRTVTVL